MTFKDLKKRVSATHEIQQQTRLFERIRHKRFWIWDIGQHKQIDIETHGDCCFNHIIGVPMKDGVEKPLFDYEKKIDDALQSNKHIWIKKSTGLGITEYFLRYIAWSASELDEVSRLLGHPKVGELSKKIDAVNPKRETTTGKDESVIPMVLLHQFTPW